TALSIMKPTSPATAPAISSTLSYSHHSASIISGSCLRQRIAAPDWKFPALASAPFLLDIAIPGRDGAPRRVRGGAEEGSLLDQPARPLVDCRNPARTIDFALGSPAIGKDPDRDEHGAAARPGP